MSKPYLTHTPLESRKVTPAMVKKYTGEARTLEDHIQQYLMQFKYDGICAILFVHADGSHHMKSRTGEDIVNFRHVGDAHSTLPWINLCEILEPDEDRPTQYKSGVYFGELWHPEWSAATITGFHNTSDPEKWIATKPKAQQVSFAVYDFVTWAEWEVGVTTVPYAERIRRLEWMEAIGTPWMDSAPVGAKFPPIFMAADLGIFAENKEFTSANEMANFVKANVNCDGVIAVDPWGGWKRGERNLAKIKLKPTLTVDVEVVGYELGKGKYANFIGKVLYLYKDQLGKCSGMTDAMRGIGGGDLETFFAEEWLGKIIEVEAMEESAHGKLREPRFKRFRLGVDATEVDA
ncbi:DNA ligase [Stenotrophomonas phage BUCT598]|uniref:DNA ligase n=1 Tax=Stenotrophomonas phage BUCT598 TaxID=2834253 RepID=A0A8F2F4I6_9CAUD|nr:DNA ligase [Stenotrophomonas phage BUCT598]